MLDTHIIAALVKEPQGPVMQALADRLPESACTSIVVAAEIHDALEKSGSVRLRRQALAILSAFDALPLETPVDRHYGEIRAHLQRQGQSIGGNDLLIAAHARALGLALVTHNIREFAKVPGLLVKDWL